MSKESEQEELKLYVRLLVKLVYALADLHPEVWNDIRKNPEFLQILEIK